MRLKELYELIDWLDEKIREARVNKDETYITNASKIRIVLIDRVRQHFKV